MNSYEKIVEKYKYFETFQAKISERLIMQACEKANECLTEDCRWIPEKICGNERNIALFLYGVGKNLDGLKEEFEEDGVI